MHKYLVIFFVIMLSFLLHGCFEDRTIVTCRFYDKYLEGMIYLLRNIDGQILYLYPTIWALILVRKLFFI